MKDFKNSHDKTIEALEVHLSYLEEW